MGLFDFGHDILIYQMRKRGKIFGEGKRGKYSEKKTFVDGEEKRKQKYVSYFAYIFAYILHIQGGFLLFRH